MAPDTAPGAAPVHEHRLANGLLVLLKQNRNAPVINLNVVYRVGSKYERPGITGISHLLEHMMFKTTAHLPLGEFDRRLKRVGADNNAYTWLDQTVYYETIAADQIDVALELEAERMQHLLVLPEDHKTEMTVVRNELDQRDDSPFTLLYEELLANAFKAHPYAIPTIGWADDVEGMTPDEIRAYYKRWYAPDNAFIVAVGDFEPEELLAQIERRFGGIPAAGVAHPRLPVEPQQRGERRFILRRAGQVDFQLLGWHIPSSAHADAYATVVLGDILGGGRTSRLYSALVDSGLCSSASADSNAFDYVDPHLFTVSASLNPGTAPEQVEALVWREVERLQHEPVTAEELARARKQARVSFVYERDSLVSEANALLEFELLPRGWQAMNDYLPGIEAVTADDVRRVAQEYLTHDNVTVGTYIATKEPGGPADADDDEDDEDEGLPELAVRRPHYKKIPVGQASLPAQTGCAIEAGQAGTPAPWNPGPRRSMNGTGGAAGARHAAPAGGPYATAHRYPSGLTLIVHENHNNPTLSVSGILLAGAVDDNTAQPGAGNLAVDMLLSGTQRRGKLELAALLENEGMSLGYGLGRENSSLSGRCLSEDWPKLLALLAETLREPAFAADELDKLRQQTIAGLLYSQSDTFETAFYHARTELYGVGHPFAGRAEGTVDSVTALAADDLRAWYGANFSPDGAVLTLVGDIDTARAIEQVGALLGDWAGPARPRDAVLARGAQVVLPGQREQRLPLPDKNSVSLVWMGAGASKTGAEWPARLVANFIFGGEFYARLNQRLRIQDGLTYGAYSWFSNGRGAGPWAAKAEVAAENVDAAIAATQEEMARYAASGPTAEELAAAQSYLTGNFPVKLATNGAVAAVLSEAHYLGRGMDYIQRYPDLVRGVTLEQTARAAAELMDPQRLLLVACGTFEEA
jgi:zinc protease